MRTKLDHPIKRIKLLFDTISSLYKDTSSLFDSNNSLKQSISLIY